MRTKYKRAMGMVRLFAMAVILLGSQAVLAQNAPYNLAATPASTSQIYLTWDESAPGDMAMASGDYVVLRSTDGASWSAIGYAYAYTPYYLDSGLAQSTTYYYLVYSDYFDYFVTYAQYNGWSGVASSRTVGPPDSPTSLSATKYSSTQINLAWSDNSSDETGFRIERKTGSGGTYATVTTTGANATSYSDTGLTPNTTYYYRVIATNAYSDSASYTNEANATTDGPPNPPSGLGATPASTTSVNLSWTDNSSNETGFKVERKTGSGGTYSQIATPAANATSYTDTGLTAGTTYYYRIRSYNAAGNSAYATEVSVIPPSAAPAAPSGLGASAVSNSLINLNWADNSTDETGFKIERKTGSGGTYAQITTVAANVTSYSDTGLTANTTYYYRIRATNVAGDSSYSNQALATTTTGSNVATGTITYTYDAFGNLTQTNAGGVTTTITYDVRGRKTEIVDPDKGDVTYRYNVAGEVVWQCDPNSRAVTPSGGTDCDGPSSTVAATMTYDDLGRMTSRTERDMVSNWYYDAYADTSTCSYGKGKLCEVTGANSYNRKYTYDSLGRTSEIVVHIDTDYTVDYGYDSSGRLETTTYPGDPTTSPATRFIAKNVYNSYGFLWKVTDSSGSTVFWQATTMDAKGRVTASTLGNGLTTASAYDVMDRLTSNTVANGGTNLQSFSYTYDSIGNLTSRTDGYEAYSEYFYYDNLNRVIASGGSSLTSHAYSYDAIGNITYKSDVGSYSYPSTSSARPHAVSSISGTVNGISNPSFTYDANGNMLTGLNRTFTYTSYDMPATISATTDNLVSAVSVELTYTYNPEHQRVRQVIDRSNSDEFTTIYLHPGGGGALLYEKEIKAPHSGTSVTEYKNYINAGGILVGVYITRSNSTTDTRYFHTDHLGSITLITDASHGVVDRMSYDVWGKRRYQDGTDDTGNTLSGTGSDRGFTGHEMLDDLGLIHMNGRIYDPLLGRFITADIQIQFPEDLQSYNRYSYVENNPLACIDPTGYSLFGFIAKVFEAAFFGPAILLVEKPVLKLAFEVIHMLPGQRLIDRLILHNKVLYSLGQVAAAYYGGPAGAAFYNSYYTYQATGSINAAMKAGAITFITAEAFVVAGNITGAHPGVFLSDAHLADVGLHALIGCASSAASGGKCGAGALSAGVSEFFTPVVSKDYAIGLIETSVIGGTASVLGGGKFANGAISGAFGYILNGRASAGPRARPYDFSWQTNKGLYSILGGLAAFSGIGLIADSVLGGTVIAEGVGTAGLAATEDVATNVNGKVVIDTLDKAFATQRPTTAEDALKVVQDTMSSMRDAQGNPLTAGVPAPANGGYTLVNGNNTTIIYSDGSARIVNTAKSVWKILGQ